MPPCSLVESELEMTYTWIGLSLFQNGLPSGGGGNYKTLSVAEHKPETDFAQYSQCVQLVLRAQNRLGQSDQAVVVQMSASEGKKLNIINHLLLATARYQPPLITNQY
jgi:hypothetical protein